MKFCNFIYTLQSGIKRKSEIILKINMPEKEIFILKKISFVLKSKKADKILSCHFQFIDYVRQEIFCEGKFHFVKNACIETEVPNHAFMLGSVCGLKISNKNGYKINLESVLSGEKIPCKKGKFLSTNH